MLQFLLPVVEAWGALSAVSRMSLVADLVAHMAAIGQPYQGLCVYIRTWLSVHSPLLLNSFPACVQLWAPLPRCEPACQVHSCWPAPQPPAAVPAPGTRGRKKSAGPGAACAVFFQTHVALREVATYAWSQHESKSFSVLTILPEALGLERGRENVKGIEWGHWLCGLCTQQKPAKAMSQAHVSATLGLAESSLLSPNLLAPLCAGWRNLRSLWYLAAGFVAKKGASGTPVYLKSYKHSCL